MRKKIARVICFGPVLIRSSRWLPHVREVMFAKLNGCCRLHGGSGSPSVIRISLYEYENEILLLVLAK